MQLCIIGNGFDLHHGIPSSYWNYREYLLSQNQYLAGRFERTDYLRAAEFSDISSKWSDLEKALRIDYESAFNDTVPYYYPDLNSEKTPGWEDIDIEIKNKLEFIKNFTKYDFYRWISEVNGYVYCVHPSQMINIDINAKFITFNYTETLEN